MCVAKAAKSSKANRSSYRQQVFMIRELIKTEMISGTLMVTIKKKEHSQNTRFVLEGAKRLLTRGY